MKIGARLAIGIVAVVVAVTILEAVLLNVGGGGGIQRIWGGG